MKCRGGPIHFKGWLSIHSWLVDLRLLADFSLTLCAANHYTYLNRDRRGRGAEVLWSYGNPRFMTRSIFGRALVACASLAVMSGPLRGDVPICAGSIFDFPPCDQIRIAAIPDEPGQGGWLAEVYLNLPIPDPPNTYHLLFAEADVAGRVPDFTFRCDAIDFPFGPAPWNPTACESDMDADLITVGDFINGPIHDISDPAMLDLPMSHLFIRFSGYFGVRLSDSSFNPNAFPSAIDFALYGFDGFRITVGSTVFRELLVFDQCDPTQSPPFPLKPPTTENGFFYALGVFPIEVTYFNRFDPTDAAGRSRAGIELYSWMGSGLVYPSGAVWVDPNNGRGPMTLMPGSLIYADDQLLPLVDGDFEGDGDVDLADYSWFPDCAVGPDSGLNIGCIAFNFDGDPDVTLADFAILQNNFEP